MEAEVLKRTKMLLQKKGVVNNAMRYLDTVEQTGGASPRVIELAKQRLIREYHDSGGMRRASSSSSSDDAYIKRARAREYRALQKSAKVMPSVKKDKSRATALAKAKKFLAAARPDVNPDDFNDDELLEGWTSEARDSSESDSHIPIGGNFFDDLLDGVKKVGTILPVLGLGKKKTVQFVEGDFVEGDGAGFWDDANDFFKSTVPFYKAVSGVVGYGKKKRKPSKYNLLVKKVMTKTKMNLKDATKYIKENKLYRK